MRQKTLVTLAVITLPVLAAALLLAPRGGHGAKPGEQAAVFPSLKEWIGTAAKITVTGPTGAVLLERKAPAPAKGVLPADGWVLADKGGYPVPDATIRPILAGLVAMKELEPKTDRPKLYSRLDLDEPGAANSHSHEIELLDANGADIVKLIVGRTRQDLAGTGDNAVYIRKPDEARTWAAAPVITLPEDWLGWIDRKLLDIDADTIKQIVLAPTGGKPLSFSRDKASDPLKIDDLPKDAKLKSETPGVEIAGGFRYLDMLDVRPAAQVTAPVFETLHLALFDGETIDANLVDQDGATWITLGAKGAGDSVKTAEALNQRVGGWAFKLAELRVKTFETKLADLVQPAAIVPKKTP